MSVLPTIGDDLMRCVDLYNQAQSKWFEEMVTTSLVIQLLNLNNLFVAYTVCLKLLQYYLKSNFLCAKLLEIS